jgi:CMP/dCMP kinase
LTSVVVAIDGTSGSGKSSTSRGVAAKLGLRYLDTGAMYRAVTWWMLQRDVDVHDAAAVAAHAGEPILESGTDPGSPTITVDGLDVAGAIRSAAVTGAVSAVSAVPEVRARMVALQRELIDDGGIVVEGRDIGSVVWPQAEVKVYLTAHPSARAERRTAEQAHTGTVESTEADLLRRDNLDSSRTASPLTKAHGAVHLDTTSHTLEKVIDLVVGLVRQVQA